MVLVLSAVLYMSVRYFMATGPKCLRCLMLMLSGPVELLFLASFMAVCVCVSVMLIGVVGSFLVVLSVVLLVWVVSCFTVFVNCLLKSLAFCLCVMAVVLLKVMVLFCVWTGFLFWRPDIVFQSRCVLVL